MRDRWRVSPPIITILELRYDAVTWFADRGTDIIRLLLLLLNKCLGKPIDFNCAVYGFTP